MFQQPFVDALAGARRVLLAGCGGGYDILGTVPLAAELSRAGKQCFFASLSFTRLDRVPGHQPVPGIPHLFRALPAAATADAYCPEAWLAAWLSADGAEVPVFCFENVGVRPLRRAYEFLVSELAIDTIIVIDGGVDSLLRGDETSLGTPAEDFATLAAVTPIGVERKLLGCVGFGAEMRDGICHAQVLERVAELTALDAFLGIWPILPGSHSAVAYQSAAAFLAEHQQKQRGSHIHRVVGAALASEFGAKDEHVWISPLASLFWFFDLDAVARTNRLLPHLGETDDLWQVAATIEAIRKTLPIRLRCSIPL
jgi:hypothetical protein